MDAHGSLLIGHQDALARNYLRTLATRDLHLRLSAEAETFNALLDEVRKGGGIDLALVDLDLPGMSGSVGLRYLTAHHKALRVAVLFSNLEPDDLERVASSGVAALVPKQTPEEALVEILRRFASGSDYVPFPSTEGSAQGHSESQLSFLDHQLTSRQSEVLRLLSRGHSNREIARLLGIADGTVKVHVNAAFRVLGVHNRVSAAAALRAYFDQSDSQLP